MEAKPLVTCHGDQYLFSTLHPIIAQGLPHEAVEWKRSYGRAPKTIRLEASFVPYDDDILPKEDERMLVSRPFYHIFWMECDLDIYRLTVKDEIQEWQTALKSRNIPEWMIVILVRDDKRVKSKLLPRTSVIDKVKNDFCHKHSDRCVVLYESGKSDQKSSESWVNFYAKLRQQLLEAFNRNLSKFEDYLRSLRDRRNEADWNFIEYFLLQEELSFIYEMIGVYDDSLIQYDELDALFTQFLINQATAYPEWLQTMIKKTSAWDNLSLAKSIDQEQRQHVKSKTASLLQLRNYLFSRQAALLFLLKRPGEVAQRGMEHLHNIVQERKMLQTETEPCAESCWVFLGCMEILNACNKYGSEKDMPVYSVYMANLWDYARRKLKQLGQGSGLMPDTCKADASSAQCDQIMGLLKTMGIPVTSRTEAEASAVEKLREALTSQEAFQKHYLELSELAMGTFKHIGRLRSARLIGKDLAQFYMQRNEPDKAELFLSDAIKMYKREGWDMLAEDTRLDLAQCQEKLGNKTRYMRSACQLASSELLTDEQRNKYFNIIMDVAKTHASSPLLIKAQNCFTFKSMTLTNDHVIIGDEIELELDIYCSFPDEITCDAIKLYMIKQPDFFTSPLSRVKSNDESQRKRHVSRASSNTSATDPMMTFNPVTPLCPKAIDLVYHCDKNVRPDFVLSSGIVCPSAHSFLRRTDSGPPPKHEADLETVVTDWYLSADDVILWPGSNVFSLKCKQTQQKAVFKLDQLSIRCGAIVFLKNQLLPSTFVTVTCEEPEFEVIPVDLDCFVAGITQKATLSLHAGSLAIVAGSQVTIHASEGLIISQPSQNETSSNATGESAFESPSGAEDRCINPAVCREYVITLDADCPANNTFNTAINLFADIQTSKKASTEYKLSCECLWSGKSYDCSLTVYCPFQVKHCLHTSGPRKFIQMTVYTDCCVQLNISKSRLNVDNTADVEMLALNKANQCLPVSRIQSSSFIWELKCNTSDTPAALDVLFDYRYACDSDTAAPPEARRHHYSFTLTNYKTLFSVNCQIKPQDDETSIQVGCQCTLLLNIRPMKCPERKKVNQLMYEVHSDKFWAISGKITGILRTKHCTCFAASLEAMPLVAGYLPLPVISLVKYTPKPSDDDLWPQDAGDVDDIAELFGEERRGVSPPRGRSPHQPSSQNLSPDSAESGDLAQKALFDGDVSKFAKGEVFLSYAGMQVQVSPQSPTTEAVQVTIETAD